MATTLTPPMPTVLPSGAVTPPPVVKPLRAISKTVSAQTPVLPTPPVLPLQAQIAGLRLLSGEEYDHLSEIGFLTKYDKIELLHGYMVKKLPMNRPHTIAVTQLQTLIQMRVHPQFSVQIQATIAAGESRPQPDVAVLRGQPKDYPKKHPTTGDVPLVVEVSDSSVAIDRSDKLQIYAAVLFPLYWIVNIPERQIEVYSNPQPTSTPPSYGTRTDYKDGDSVPLVLDDLSFAIAVSDVLPAITTDTDSSTASL